MSAEKYVEGVPLREFEALPELKRQKGKCSSLICNTFILIIALVLLSAGVSSYMLVSKSRCQSSTLAIASDVIECARPISLLYRYSTIIINETPSDGLNDNPMGLTMDLFSLKKSDIIYHSYLDTNKNFELVLPTTGLSRFILPYNYYNRPWYLWAGSTINITFKVIYKEKPTAAILYLFKGETRINSFFSEKESIPTSEQHMDMLSMDGNDSVVWQVQGNDYYYVAVHTVGSKDTVFKSNVTFNLTYIDVEDYPWFKDTAQRATGVNQPLTLHRSISSWSNNRTLCYMHAVPRDSLASSSIHLNTVYYTGSTMKAVLITTPFGLLLLFFVSVLGYCCMCQTHNTCSRRRREKSGYMLIN